MWISLDKSPLSGKIYYNEKGDVMKKIMLIAALALMTTNATAGEWKLQKSVFNDSNVALQLLKELNYFLKGGIDLNNVVGAVIGTV